MSEMNYLKNIRALRKKAHYTQQDVSDRLNIQRQTYSNYENGFRMLPLDIIIDIAELYEVSVDYLIRSEGESDPPENYRHLCTGERVMMDNISHLTAGSQIDVCHFIHYKAYYPS
ncbi:MAG: helix-turn-helix domain-containing protein [Lachnospiraceae bacterium]|nr:helix-turn-helix domain-containing protein [Lachnospiraceae bacterium]